MAGSVSGWQTMVVTPPAAAAWLAEAMLSRPSAPGSPMKARMSIRPGATIWPRHSTTSVPSGTPAAPMPRLASRITPSAISRSPGKSRSRDGSMIRALASRIGRRSRRSISIGYAFGRLRDSASSTAMRTATPISTCSRISDCAPSATMESISTPRFIGPGCITSASGLA